MSEEALSQAEIEHLLNALLSAEDAQPQPGRQAPPEKVVLYDFKRPERVGKDQMRALQSLHEGFSRNFAAKLSALIRSLVEVHLSSVDQMTYSEFVFGLEGPTCFNILKASPLDGYFLLDLSPEILFPLIDRLLGGAKGGSTVQRRPLTEIERRLAGRVTRIFNEELENAWEGLTDLSLNVERVESNPQLAQVVPPNEVVVVLCFEASLFGSKGVMSLCIPYNSIEHVSSKLSANTWAAYGQDHSTPSTRRLIVENLQSARLAVSVELGRTTISTNDLIGLQVGDVIALEKPADAPMTLYIENAAKFHCSPGAVKGRKAVEITGPAGQEPGDPAAENSSNAEPAEPAPTEAVG